MNFWLLLKISKLHFFKNAGLIFLLLRNYNWSWTSVLVVMGCGWLSKGQNLSVNLAKACDEQMLKISKRYLDSFLSNGQLSEKLLLPMDPLWTLLVKVSKGGPLVVTFFQLFGHYSNKNQDIFLKFSAFLYHMCVLNWHKNLGLCSNSLPSTAHFGRNFERL